MNMMVPTMSSTSLFLEKERWPQSWPTTNHCRQRAAGAVGASARVRGRAAHVGGWAWQYSLQCASECSACTGPGVLLTPVSAVPENAQAKGSSGAGQMEMM